MTAKKCLDRNLSSPPSRSCLRRQAAFRNTNSLEDSLSSDSTKEGGRGISLDSSPKSSMRHIGPRVSFDIPKRSFTEMPNPHRKLSDRTQKLLASQESPSSGSLEPPKPVAVGPRGEEIKRRQSTIYTSSDTVTEQSAFSDWISLTMIILSYVFFALTFPLCLLISLKVIKIDLRVVSFDVPPQEILSKDSVTISVDAVVYFRINDPVVSVINVNDCFYSTKLLAQTTLRNILATKTLAEMLQERDHISSTMESMLFEATLDWGVKVERVEVKDIRLPKDLMRAMAAEAEAAREARARVVTAQGELRASHALKDAADFMTQPIAFQLRYLQTLDYIAAEKNSTIIYPVPIDMVSLALTSTTRAVVSKGVITPACSIKTALQLTMRNGEADQPNFEKESSSKESRYHLEPGENIWK